MCTRSQYPRYQLQGISLVCFILYFSKQATARRVCEVALQLTSATSGLIGGDEFLFQWYSKGWWDNNQGTSYLCREQCFAVSQCQETFSLFFSAHFIFCYFPQSQHYEGEYLFRNGQEIVELWTPFFVVKCHYIRFLPLVYKYVHISVQFFFQN